MTGDRQLLATPPRALLILLGALTAFGPMSLDLYLPAFQLIANDFSVDISAVGLTFSASLLGLGIGQLFYGPVSDRYGRKIPLLFGLMIFIIASIACALATNLELLVVSRFLQALGGSAGIVLARAMVRDLYSGKDMARVLSLVAVVFGLAPVLAPTLGAFILRLGSWRVVFIVLALFGLMCLVGVLRLRETLPTDRRVAHSIVGALRNYGFVARQKGFLSPAFVAALSSMGLFAYISSSPRVYLTEYGLTPQQFGLAFGAGALAFVAGAQLNARLLKTFSIRRLLVTYLFIQLVAATAGLIIVSLNAPVILLIAALAMYQACTGGVTGNALSEALSRFVKLAGTAAAFVGVMQLGSSAFLSAGITFIPLPAALLLMILLASFSSAAVVITLVQVGRARRAVVTGDNALLST
jgi:DHA1 family bicyclomycin/chloramphenicol resistance-like MFS transporter